MRSSYLIHKKIIIIIKKKQKKRVESVASLELEC
jgi:hypothetical protein